MGVWLGFAWGGGVTQSQKKIETLVVLKRSTFTGAEECVK